MKGFDPEGCCFLDETRGKADWCDHSQNLWRICSEENCPFGDNPHQPPCQKKSRTIKTKPHVVMDGFVRPANWDD